MARGLAVVARITALAAAGLLDVLARQGGRGGDVGAVDGRVGGQADRLDPRRRVVLPLPAGRLCCGAALRLVVCVGIALRAGSAAQRAVPSARGAAIVAGALLNLRGVVQLAELLDVHGIGLCGCAWEMCEGGQAEDGGGSAGEPHCDCEASGRLSGLLDAARRRSGGEGSSHYAGSLIALVWAPEARWNSVLQGQRVCLEECANEGCVRWCNCAGGDCAVLPKKKGTLRFA